MHISRTMSSVKSFNLTFNDSGASKKDTGIEFFECVVGSLDHGCLEKTPFSSQCCSKCQIAYFKRNGTTCTGATIEDLLTEISSLVKKIPKDPNSEELNLLKCFDEFRDLLMDQLNSQNKCDIRLYSRCECGKNHRRDLSQGSNAHILECSECGPFCSNCTNGPHPNHTTCVSKQETNDFFHSTFVQHIIGSLKFHGKELEEHNKKLAEEKETFNQVASTQIMKCCPYSLLAYKTIKQKVSESLNLPIDHPDVINRTALKHFDNCKKCEKYTKEAGIGNDASWPTTLYCVEKWKNMYENGLPLCTAQATVKTHCDHVVCGEHNAEHRATVKKTGCGVQSWWTFWTCVKPIFHSNIVEVKPLMLQRNMKEIRVEPLYSCNICNNLSRTLSFCCDDNNCSYYGKKVCSDCICQSINLSSGTQLYEIKATNIMDGTIIVFEQEYGTNNVTGTYNNDLVIFKKIPLNRWEIRTQIDNFRQGVVRKKFQNSDNFTDLIEEGLSFPITFDSCDGDYIWYKAEVKKKYVFYTDTPFEKKLREFKCIHDSHIIHFDPKVIKYFNRQNSALTTYTMATRINSACRGFIVKKQVQAIIRAKIHLNGLLNKVIRHKRVHDNCMKILKVVDRIPNNISFVSTMVEMIVKPNLSKNTHDMCMNILNIIANPGAYPKYCLIIPLMNPNECWRIFACVHCHKIHKRRKEKYVFCGKCSKKSMKVKCIDRKTRSVRICNLHCLNPNCRKSLVNNYSPGITKCKECYFSSRSAKKAVV